jgi:VWFA-related protein
MKSAISLAALLWVPACFGQAPAPPAVPAPSLTTQTTLVLVPALVRTRSGDPVFTLTAKDFTVTDDGVPQQAAVEPDTGAEPLALVIAIETGGAGARQLPKLRTLASLVEAVVGDVPHRVAVVAFDGESKTVQDFTFDFAQVSDAIRGLRPSTGGPATLDALAYSVDLLRSQPPEYRRAILLISEILDHASQTTLDQALHAVSDTNTAIYSLGFSSTKAALKGEAAKFDQRETPGPAGGCMAKDPNADPGVSRLAQTFECLNILLPPLRAAKMAAELGANSLRRNVPESVTQLTGGEYFTFTDAHSLERDLETIGHHLPNRYVLSFHPLAPHPGFHTIGLRLKDYPHLVVVARNGYWVDTETAAAGNP